MMKQASTGFASRAAPAAAVALAILATPAQAQAQTESGGTKPDLIVSLGGGGQFAPRFPGADHSEFFPIPYFAWRRDGDPLPFTAADRGVSFGLFGSDSAIDIGPTVLLQGSRKDKDVGAPVGKVDATIEAGAFVHAYPVRWLRLRLAARRGIGGHDAWDGDLSADLLVRNAQTTIFSVGPRLRFADAKFNRAYFGVTPAAATASGLPAYHPGSGLYSAGVATSITRQLSETWGFRAFGGYDRLIDDAGDSPLVRRYGSRDQWSGSLAVTYSFRIHRGGHAQ